MFFQLISLERFYLFYFKLRHSNVEVPNSKHPTAKRPQKTSRVAVKEPAIDFHLINKKVRQLYDRRFFSNHRPTQRNHVRNKNTEIRQQRRGKKRPKGRRAECAFMSPERPKRESPKGLTLSLIYSRQPTPFRQCVDVGVCRVDPEGGMCHLLPS